MAWWHGDAEAGPPAGRAGGLVARQRRGRYNRWRARRGGANGAAACGGAVACGGAAVAEAQRPRTARWRRGGGTVRRRGRWPGVREPGTGVWETEEDRCRMAPRRRAGEGEQLGGGTSAEPRARDSDQRPPMEKRRPATSSTGKGRSGRDDAQSAPGDARSRPGGARSAPGDDELRPNDCGRWSCGGERRWPDKQR